MNLAGVVSMVRPVPAMDELEFKARIAQVLDRSVPGRFGHQAHDRGRRYANRPR